MTSPVLVHTAPLPLGRVARAGGRGSAKRAKGELPWSRALGGAARGPQGGRARWACPGCGPRRPPAPPRRAPPATPPRRGRWQRGGIPNEIMIMMIIIIMKSLSKAHRRRVVREGGGRGVTHLVLRGEGGDLLEEARHGGHHVHASVDVHLHRVRRGGEDMRHRHRTCQHSHKHRT